LHNGKPVIIEDYNKTKFGVDIYDKMAQSLAFRPTTRRWPVRLFTSFVIDGATHNAHILFDKSMDRRAFIYLLADQLMDKQKEVRAKSDNATVKKFLQIEEIYKR
jgi:hypothetical protein